MTVASWLHNKEASRLLRLAYFYALRRALPRARRRARILRPLAEAMRLRKPCSRFWVRFLGWKVGFIRVSPYFLPCRELVYTTFLFLVKQKALHNGPMAVFCGISGRFSTFQQYVLLKTYRFLCSCTLFLHLCVIRSSLYANFFSTPAGGTRRCGAQTTSPSRTASN